MSNINRKTPKFISSIETNRGRYSPNIKRFMVMQASWSSRPNSEDWINRKPDDQKTKWKKHNNEKPKKCNTERSVLNLNFLPIYMISINQLNAQIKLVEIWRASNIDNYPLKLNKKQVVPENTNTRACTQGKLIVPGTKPIMQKSFITDAMKIWNTCPIWAVLKISKKFRPSAVHSPTKPFVVWLPSNRRTVRP